MVALLKYGTLRPLDINGLKCRTETLAVFPLAVRVTPHCRGGGCLFLDFWLLCISKTLLSSTQMPWHLPISLRGKAGDLAVSQSLYMF